MLILAKLGPETLKYLGGHPGDPGRSDMEHSGTGLFPSWIVRRYLEREFTPWSETDDQVSEGVKVMTVVGPVRVERRLRSRRGGRALPAS